METILDQVANKLLQTKISCETRPVECSWTDMFMLKDPLPKTQGVAHFVDIVEKTAGPIDYDK
eukprot:11533108-Karenia_brevis.AAC.1